MEQTDRTEVIPYRGVWSDLGTWDRIWNHAVKDKDGSHSKGGVYHNNYRNTLLLGHSHPAVAIGLQDVVAIDAPLVSSKGSVRS